MNKADEQRPTAPIGALERPDYAPRSTLAARDLLTEQRYRGQRLRRHNRHLHGWGVVCGLRVVPAGDPRRPWALLICPGYAIGPYGDEIEVSTPALLDIHDYLWRVPQDVRKLDRAYVGIRYAERQTCPVPADPVACGCDETRYRPSRIQDGLQAGVLWQLPKRDDAEGFEMCEEGQVPCPDCSESPYVILARVTLPGSRYDPITSEDIVWESRRQTEPTDVLQRQLIACCCTPDSPRLEQTVAVTTAGGRPSSVPHLAAGRSEA